ncbi:MAG TPA: glycosyltransferase family 2 protein, partial [Urbifossiella sp.]|nr:glycosyltransferase family 2 protein [Urbifossiella sp.]
MPTADLSVVMPNYNHARYLPRALDAIFAQSVLPREVVVVDDASTDNSVAVLEGYARRFPHLRLVRNERNLGVVGAMNRGAQLALGRYLGFAAADDYVLPDFYEKTITLFERHPHAGLCCAYDSFKLGEDGPLEPNPSGWPADRADYYPPAEVARLLRHTIPGHSGIFRRDALQAAGWFDPALAWYCDWFVNLTLAFRHGACHIPEPLSVRILLPENYSAQAKPGEKHRAVLRAFLDRVTDPAHV